MSQTPNLIRHTVTFTMYKGHTQKKESFECKTGAIDGHQSNTYNCFDINKVIPDPADFLPSGIDLFSNIENDTKSNKLLANPNIFKRTFILSLLLVVFVVISNILCNSYSNLNPKQSKTDTCTMIIAKNSKYNYLKEIYKKEWDDIYENIRKLQQQTEKMKTKLEITLNGQRKLKTKIEDFRAETLSILARKFEEVNTKIDDAFTLYDADKIGKTDYALESAGGSILSTPDTQPYPSNRYINFLGVKVQSASDPFNIIRPGTLPGQCFAFRGGKARIRIQLVRPVIINSVTMDYPHQKLLTDTSSAPRDFIVYGMNKLKPQVSKHELGHFTFYPSNRTVVTFSINTTKKLFHEYVELKILNNHGHPNYTCIYRFRVHGKEKYSN